MVAGLQPAMVRAAEFCEGPFLDHGLGSSFRGAAAAPVEVEDMLPI